MAGLKDKLVPETSGKVNTKARDVNLNEEKNFKQLELTFYSRGMS